MCYGRNMGESVSVRELRNSVSELLRRVERGEHVTVTVDRRPVAAIVPLRRRRGVPVREALAVARRQPADRALLDELGAVLLDTTDDV